MFFAESVGSSVGPFDESSPSYQLELNLQAIRLEVIYTTESADNVECLRCNLLQCRCVRLPPVCIPCSSDASSYFELGLSYSTASSRASCDRSEFGDIEMEPPPPQELPLPLWAGQCEVNEDQARWEDWPAFDDMTAEVPSSHYVETWLETCRSGKERPRLTEQPSLRISNVYDDERLSSCLNMSWPAMLGSIWRHDNSYQIPEFVVPFSFRPIIDEPTTEDENEEPDNEDIKLCACYRGEHTCMSKIANYLGAQIKVDRNSELSNSVAEFFKNFAKNRFR